MNERRADSRYYRNGAVTEEFHRLMETLAEALGCRVTEAQVRAHAQLFADVEIDDLMMMFRRAAREIEFGGGYPTPGLLRTFLRPRLDDAALLAWSTLSQAAERVGAWQNLYVDDPALAAAVDAVFGSWPEFCALADGPQLTLKRQEFIAAYKTARRFGEALPPRVLIGLCGPTDPEVAEHVWAGRIKLDGTIETKRDVAALPAAPQRKEIDGGTRDTEAGTEKARQGSEEAPRARRDRRRQT